jgi:hypothetical protein
MKIRGLIIACLVFVMLAGVLYWSEHRKPAGETARASTDTPPILFKLDPAAITRIELKRKGTEPIVLGRENSDRWRIREPKPFDADQNTVSSLLATLSSLNSERVVEEKASDLKPYGLDPPALEVDITEKDNRVQKLLLGDDTPAGKAVYTALAGDPRLFTVSSFSKSRIDQGLDDLRNKKLFDLSFNSPDKVALHIGTKAYLFTRTGEDWWADGKKLDANNVRALVATLRGLTATGFAGSGFSRPVIEAAVTTDDGKRVEKVLIAKSGDGYLAKRETEPDFYQLNSNSVVGLQKAAEAIKPVASASK